MELAVTAERPKSKTQIAREEAQARRTAREVEMAAMSAMHITADRLIEEPDYLLDLTVARVMNDQRTPRETEETFDESGLPPSGGTLPPPRRRR